MSRAHSNDLEKKVTLNCCKEALTTYSSNLLFSYPVPVPIGYTFRIVPSTIIYLPIRVKRFDEITFKIVNENGNLIDFNGYTIRYVVLIEQV